MRHSSTYEELRAAGFLPRLWWGVLGTFIMAVGSWGAGAKMDRGTLIVLLNMDWLRYGHGQILCQVLFWVGLLLLLANWIRLGRDLLDSNMRWRISGQSLMLITILWMMPLLVAGPLLSRDIYSYLAQGTIQEMGFSAYNVGPYVINGSTPGDFSLLYLEVSGDWRNTTTPYGPLHLGLMQGIVVLTRHSIYAGIIVVKLLCMVSLVVIAFSASSIARSLGQSEALAVWLAAANPLVILHLIGGMHNEAFMVAFMTAGLALVLKRHHLVGIGVITLGAAIKATAFVAMPFVIWIWLAHLRESGKSRRQLVGYFFLTSIGGATISIATFALLSCATDTGVGFIQALSGSGKVINWLTLPTAFAHMAAQFGIELGGPNFTTSLEAARKIFTFVMIICLLGTWLHWRRTAQEALRGLAVAFLVICLCNSLAFPWYYSWILAFVGALGLSDRSLQIITALCAWGCIIVRPNGIITLYNWFFAIAAVIVGVLTYRYLRTSPRSLDSAAMCLPK